MKPEELGEEIAIELELMEATVRELSALQHDLAGREPTVREKTAAAAFLAQFYNGVENIQAHQPFLCRAAAHRRHLARRLV